MILTQSDRLFVQGRTRLIARSVDYSVSEYVARFSQGVSE